ncbi:MAG: signal peptide peptidase SppA [Sphingomicrobium sp.]
MKFVGAVWKLLVGIKDALVLLLLILFFGFLYAALSARPAAVGEGVLDLSLTGSVVEQPARPGWAEALGGEVVRDYRLRDLTAALDSAKSDSRVKAVALDLDGFTGGGQAALGDLADAIRRVRASGKPVIAYGSAFTSDGYQLAAAASEIWLNPLGGVLIVGPGGTNLYFKGLLDKLGVTANVYRVGTYKSAVEPFTRNDMSPEARENYQALGNALLESWRHSVRTSRPKADVDLFLRDMPGAIAASGGDMAKAALAAGLVDKVGERQAFEARLAELGGAGTGEYAFQRIALPDFVRDIGAGSGSGPIGIVTVAGTIVDGEAGPGTAGGDTIAEEIARAVDEDVKALVVRVDSPGGSVMASERIRQALIAAKAKGIPVVVSMGNVAASGGYWIAAPADFIYAEPSTITGSIGVFGVLPSFQGSLAKLGIGADGVKTTPLSGEPDLLRGPSPEANALIQTSVEATYRRFLDIVAKARRKTPQQVDAIAQGRVWDGGTARQLGLIDGFGGIEEAVAKAAALAKLGDERGVRYIEPPMSVEEELIEMVAGDREDDSAAPADAFATFAEAPKRQFAAMLTELQSLLDGPVIQARCLECGPAASPSPTVKAERSGLWGALVGRLLG